MVRAGFQTIDRISHRAALVGRVLDALTLAPLAAAEVVITDGPAGFKARLAARGLTTIAQRSDASGTFRWLDLVAGTYTLRASLSAAAPRYAAAITATAVVTASGAPASLDLALAPTALVGKVVAGAPAAALPMARVRLVDSGETVFTGADGTFTLTPLEPGTARVVELGAPRYQTLIQEVTLSQGKTTSLAPVVLTHL